jgi:hypothetical protein
VALRDIDVHAVDLEERRDPLLCHEASDERGRRDAQPKKARILGHVLEPHLAPAPHAITDLVLEVRGDREARDPLKARDDLLCRHARRRGVPEREIGEAVRVDVLRALLDLGAAHEESARLLVGGVVDLEEHGSVPLHDGGAGAVGTHRAVTLVREHGRRRARPLATPSRGPQAQACDTDEAGIDRAEDGRRVALDEETPAAERDLEPAAAVRPLRARGTRMDRFGCHGLESAGGRLSPIHSARGRGCGQTLRQETIRA